MVLKLDINTAFTLVFSNIKVLTHQARMYSRCKNDEKNDLFFMDQAQHESKNPSLVKHKDPQA